MSVRPQRFPKLRLINNHVHLFLIAATHLDQLCESASIKQKLIQQGWDFVAAAKCMYTVSILFWPRLIARLTFARGTPNFLLQTHPHALT